MFAMNIIFLFHSTNLSVLHTKGHTKVLRRLEIPAFGFCCVRGANGAYMHAFAVPDNSLDELQVRFI